MLQHPLCPNLTKKVQKKVAQITNHNLLIMILLGGLSVNLIKCKLKPSKNQRKKFSCLFKVRRPSPSWGTRCAALVLRCSGLEPNEY